MRLSPKRSYVVLNQITVEGEHSDVGYEEIALVEATTPRYAAREALRFHSETIQPPMSEVIVIPASAIKIVRTDRV